MSEVTILRRSDYYVTFIVDRDKDPRPVLATMNAHIINTPERDFAPDRTVWDVYPLPDGTTQVIAWAFPASPS